MTTSTDSHQNAVTLTGLDGSNPLAFLAALGVLNVLSKQHLCSMSWCLNDGTWSPRLHVGVTVDSIAETIVNLLDSDLNEPWNLSKKLPFEATLFRNAMLATVQVPDSMVRSTVDTFAAFGSEVFCDEKGQFQDTAFRMVRSGDSAGQGLPDYACKMAIQCGINDIKGTLFGPWTFAKGLSSFRWDPSENREYALQAINPSKDGSTTPIGVNRLALEALALFPTMPGVNGLETVGFIKGSRGTDAKFRWPIWEVPLSIDAIRSLLTCSQLYMKTVDTNQLREIGVAALFYSRQIKPNQYYRNFTPSFQV